MRIRIQVLMQLNMDVKQDPGGKNVNFGHPSPRGRWGTGNLFLHPRHLLLPVLSFRIINVYICAAEMCGDHREHGAVGEDRDTEAAGGRPRLPARAQGDQHRQTASRAYCKYSTAVPVLLFESLICYLWLYSWFFLSKVESEPDLHTGSGTAKIRNRREKGYFSIFQIDFS